MECLVKHAGQRYIVLGTGPHVIKVGEERERARKGLVDTFPLPVCCLGEALFKNVRRRLGRTYISGIKEYGT